MATFENPTSGHPSYSPRDVEIDARGGEDFPVSGADEEVKRGAFLEEPGRSSRGFRKDELGGRIKYVRPQSPADDAGFTPGCFITAADGHRLHDIIDWRWYASDSEVTLEYVDTDGDAGSVCLEREEGEDWGISFENLVFNHVKQCCNACTFCFMHMLPRGMRPSLYLRDDDFRLSFLVGTFVTLTNLSAEDERRIIEEQISPLRFSLHVINPDIRREIIGKHAQRGIGALERLLEAGIEVHAQIVLMPGKNDGDALRETLTWAYSHPGILSVGIVPLGYTKFQTRFNESYNEKFAALAVLKEIEEFQKRALEERGNPWVFAADEFYSNAYTDSLLDHLPPRDFYGDFSLFEDGIGIIRSAVDEWQEADQEGLVQVCADALTRANTKVRAISGYAQRNFYNKLIMRGSLAGMFEPLYVKNDFFGGNVDVTGLLVGADIAAAIREDVGKSGKQDARYLYCIPSIVFNDDEVTLDGMGITDIEEAVGIQIQVVSCKPREYLTEIADRVSAF